MSKPLRPLNRVAQRDWERGDCGLACVAAIADKKYETLLADFRALPGKARVEYFFTRHKDLQALLLKHGYETERRRFRSWRKITGHAIVKVNLKNDKNWHWVVHDGGRQQQVAHDPKPGKRKLITDFRGLRGSGYYLAVMTRAG